MNNSRIMRGLAIVWTIIIFIGCLTPHEDIPVELLTWSDKLQHIAIFIPFAFLWTRAGFRPNTVLLAGIFVGGLIEVLQYLLPINRSADWLDLVADFIGTVIGLGIGWSIQKVMNG